MVTNPEATMLAVCAFLQEDFLTRMLDTLPGGISEEEDVPTLRPSLSKTDLLATHTFAKRHLLEFGYPLKPVALSAGERLRYALVDLPVNLAGLLAWNLIDRREFQRAGSPKE
jgi:hypothetical protein